MNKLEKSFASVAVLSTLFGVTQAAIACIPPPPHILNPVSAIEFKLPKLTPSYVVSSATTCPQDLWPFVFHGLTDAQIVQYLGTTSTPTSIPLPPAAPAWDSTKIYLLGDKVTHVGKVFAARYWTQGDTPSGASAVWDEQVDIFGNPPTWYATKAYSGGATVTYGAHIYSAKWWTQGETPGVAGNAWALVGPANGRRPALFHVSAANSVGRDANGNQILKLSWNTDLFSLADSPLANNWKVMVNGVVVQQGANILAAVTDCAANSPSCVPKYMQTGSFLVPKVYKEQLTFWLCAGNACRPTPRVRWYQGGSDGPNPITTP